MKAKKVFTFLISLLLLAPTTVNASENYTSLFQPVVRGDQSSESVYFVMTDRFSDGNPSNNGDGYDPTDIGYWHGGDFQGLTEKLPYIADLGVTALWITPPFKQQSIQGNSSAYHGYWALDFMTVDPHLGTEAEFKKLISTAHSMGLKVFIDVVANHTADVISYKDGKPYIPAGKENIKNPAFLNDINNYHNAGDSTFEGESSLIGDFFGLDDIKTTNQEVIDFTKNLLVGNYAQYGLPAPDDQELTETAARLLQNKEQANGIYDRLAEQKLTDFFKSSVNLVKKEVKYDDFIKLASAQ